MDTNSTEGTGTIVVGLDGSANSDRAFDVALEIAHKRSWALRLIGAFAPPYPVDGFYVEAVDAMRRTAESTALQHLAEIGDRAAQLGVDVSWDVREGDAGGVLIDMSRHAQLVVVGKRGRGRIAGRLLGSVSGRLAAHAACPTLVVPEKWEAPESGALFAPQQDHTASVPDEDVTLLEESAGERGQQRTFENVPGHLNFDGEVVAAVDIGHGHQDVALRAAESAHVHGRPLTLLSAIRLDVDSENWYPSPLARNLVDAGRIRRLYTEGLTRAAEAVAEKHPDLTVHWRFYDGSTAGVIAEASRTAGLVVIGTRGHGGFAGLLLGSVSQSVLNRSVSPVLVVPVKHRD